LLVILRTMENAENRQAPGGIIDLWTMM